MNLIIQKAVEEFENKHGETFSESGLEIVKKTLISSLTSAINNTVLQMEEMVGENIGDDSGNPAQDSSVAYNDGIDSERSRLRSSLDKLKV